MVIGARRPPAAYVSRLGAAIPCLLSMDRADLTFPEGHDLDVGIDHPLQQPCNILLIAGKAIHRFHHQKLKPSAVSVRDQSLDSWPQKKGGAWNSVIAIFLDLLHQEPGAALLAHFAIGLRHALAGEQMSQCAYRELSPQSPPTTAEASVSAARSMPPADPLLKIGNQASQTRYAQP